MFDWDTTWVNANPDGMAERRVIGINGEWPLPLLNFTKSDRVIANVYNQLGNQSTTIHFHGLFQNGMNNMDGAVGVTQCGILPGSSFLYNFIIGQPGTYWYHSHTRGQYPDELRGRFLVHDPGNPYRGQYDVELAITLSKWYHDEMPGLLAKFISPANPDGAEPVPKSALLNDTQNLTISVQPGKTCFFRMTNVGAFAGQYLWIEGRTMIIVEVDGVYTEPDETNMIYVAASLRMDTGLFDSIPAGSNPNITGWLMYDESAGNPMPTLIDAFDPYDDFELVRYDGIPLLDRVDYSFNLDVTMTNLADGASYPVPLSTGSNASNPALYGKSTNAFVLEKCQVVEVVLNNADDGKHPFHLHGHIFQFVWRSKENASFWNPRAHAALPPASMRRDVVTVESLGSFVVRFRAPGVWLFYCHIDWHLAGGLAAVMVNASLELQKTSGIPESIYQAR